MSRATLRRIGLIFAGLSAVFSVSQHDSRAEVGVALDASFARSPYVQIIVDDPSPVGTAWRRFSASPSRVVLNAQGEANGDGSPDFVLNPVSSLPIVVWARNNAGNFDVVVSAFSGGAWSTPQVVAGSPSNELDPRVVVDSAGTVHLLYWVDTGATQRVYYRHAPSDLSSWSAAIPVSGLGDAACRPGATIPPESSASLMRSIPPATARFRSRSSPPHTTAVASTPKSSPRQITRRRCGLR